MKEPIKLAVIMFNTGMFAATGESDKPAITITLTDKQTKKIRDYCEKMKMDVLSIHLITK